MVTLISQANDVINTNCSSKTTISTIDFFMLYLYQLVDDDSIVNSRIPIVYDNIKVSNLLKS